MILAGLVRGQLEGGGPKRHASAMVIWPAESSPQEARVYQSRKPRAWFFSLPDRRVRASRDAEMREQLPLPSTPWVVQIFALFGVFL